MSQSLEMPPVHEPFIDLLSSTDAGTSLGREEQELILRQADHLPFQWLRSAWQKTKTQSMHVLVRIAQEGVILLLDLLGSNKGKQRSWFHKALEDKFTSFIVYLQRNYSSHFNTKIPMPDNMWEAIQGEVDRLFETGVESPMRLTDRELQELMRSCYHASTRPEAPSFATAGYWLKLSEKITDLPPCEDMTLRVIYLLVTCNFNSAAFVSYLLHRFGYGLSEEDAARQWAGYMQQVNRIAQAPGVCFDDTAPPCKEQLTARISEEISAIGFAQQVLSNDAAADTRMIHTNLTVSQLAGLIRLLVEAEILVCDNHGQLMKHITASFRSRNQHAFTAESLRQKYYQQDPATTAMLRTHLANMTALLKGYAH